MLKLPSSRNVVQRAGRRGKGSRRQGGKLSVLRRAAQAGRDWLWQVHVDRAQLEDNRSGFLARSPGKPEDATARGVGVGWHVGGHISSVVDLCKQCAGNSRGVTQLLKVSKGLREGCQARRIEEAYH